MSCIIWGVLAVIMTAASVFTASVLYFLFYNRAEDESDSIGVWWDDDE